MLYLSNTVGKILRGSSWNSDPWGFFAPGSVVLAPDNALMES